MRMPLATLALVSLVTAPQVHAYDPSADWQTLQTPHFTLHFPQDQAELAQKAARIAERVHDELTPRLGWTPATRTEMVLADESDLPNGFAEPLPYNQIHLIAAAPEPGEFLTVSDENEWLYQLIRHEYVHILHLDAATRAPARLRQIFGRHWFTFPNVLQPGWAIEGLATDLETDPARLTGRGAESDLPMYMRAEVLHGVKPLAQVSLGGAMQEWPHGLAMYLYGLHFYQFLRERYGEDAALRMNLNYRGNLVPFRIDDVARRTTGKPTMKALWAEFTTWLEARYQPQITAIRSAGVHEGQLAGEPGTISAQSSVKAMADGSVYYVRAPESEPASLTRLTADGATESLAHVHFLARFDVHPVRGVALAQLEVCGNERLYYDLYVLEPGTRIPRRITRCQRYRHVAWRPDGQTVYAVQEKGGHSSIDELDLDGRVLRTVWVAPDGERVTQFAVSPDGHTLVFVRSATGRGSDLVALDMTSGALRPLTQDRNSEVRPSFTPDGKAVLYSSDHGGISNLRRLDLATGQVTTLTHTLTGAFMPSQGQVDGPVWFARFTAEGYRISRLDRPLATTLPAPKAADPAPVRVTIDAPLPSTPYSPWPTMAPRSWLPYAGIDSAHTIIGVTTGGADVLGRHNWQVAAARDFSTDTWLGGAFWNYRDRLLLSYQRSEKTWLDASDEAALVRSVDTAGATLQLPVLGMSRQFQASTGVVWEQEKDVWRATGVAPRATTVDAVAGVALALNTAWTLRDSAGPTSGRFVRLQWETSDVLDSDYSGDALSGEWREYFSLGSGRVLAGRLAMARGDAGIKRYELGGSLNESQLLRPVIGFNQRDIDVRSYDDGTLSGRGYQLGIVELRTPLVDIDRTLTAPPLGLSRLQGTLFVEGARAYETAWSPWYSGVGTELLGRVVLGYWIPVDVRLGVAIGLRRQDDHGGARAYLSVGYAF